jgi:ubiquinone/menaquinone biosynthesis C-methylase UbiE
MFQKAHDVLPENTHDEFAREEFCGTLRKFFSVKLWPGTHDVYEGMQLPAFEARHGRAPKTRQEVKDLMEETFYYRASNLIGRCAQELLWDTVGESVERQLGDLNQKAKKPRNPVGSLELHPEMPMPRYIESVDIHVMPGNFQTELCEDDLYAGALYDRGVYYFAYGTMGADNHNIGIAMCKYVKEEYPDFKPKRILDVGCGVGFSTLPWKEYFPDAEVYGIDVGAPMVRYAHARAESWGVPVHFSQQNGTTTNFPDGFFDIVTSCLVNHEAPVHVINDLFKEGHRILAKGGLYLTDGGYKRDVQPPEKQLLGDWFTNNVNEPFASGLSRIDYAKSFEKAGFNPDGFFISGSRPAAYMSSMFDDKKKKVGGVSYVGSFKL